MATHGGMRLTNAAHEAHPWLIAEIAPDFRLLDAWALPAEGGPGGFPEFLETISKVDLAGGASRASRALFAIRWWLGRVFGWDRKGDLAIPGSSERSLAERLPAELRGTAGGRFPAGKPGEDSKPGSFRWLYRTDDEAAAEISNGTVHGVLHLGWAPLGNGRYRAHLGVYVKPRGRTGEIYLALIGPARHLIVYPALLRQVGRAWEARDR